MNASPDFGRHNPGQRLERRRSPRALSRVLIAAALFIAGCTPPAPPPAQGPRTVVVESPQPLSHGAVDVYAGSVRARVEADLAFRVAGKIASRAVDVGAHVQRGAVLAALDQEDARLDLAAAQSALKAAEADLWIAQNEQKRALELRTRGFISQSDVDKRKSAAMLARARRDQARAELDLTRNKSEYTTLRAETAGVVTAVLAEAGTVVGAGQPVVRVAVDGEREVLIQVPEGGASTLRGAKHVDIALYADASRRYAGRVREISPQADAQTRTQDVRVTIVGADAAVQLGATATVFAGEGLGRDSFRVPATALGNRDGHKAVVWRIAAGSDGALATQPVSVDVEQYLDDGVIVAGDLHAADRLISAGVHLLEPGMAVTPVERSALAAQQ